ncbi:MAG: hypothetical protein K9M15_01695 [Candidatus Marinimicrobia bacterium]|nr:hypothetical protein [Candidatus Neomarinimicrobiota bacterium]
MTAPFDKVSEYLKLVENDDYKIEFRWIDKKTFASIESEKSRISINLNLIITYMFTHEILHSEYPKVKETFVEKKTEEFIDKMTVKEIKKLARRILKNTLTT